MASDLLVLQDELRTVTVPGDTHHGEHLRKDPDGRNEARDLAADGKAAAVHHRGRPRPVHLAECTNKRTILTAITHTDQFFNSASHVQGVTRLRKMTPRVLDFILTVSIVEVL